MRSTMTKSRLNGLELLFIKTDFHLDVNQFSRKKKRIVQSEDTHYEMK